MHESHTMKGPSAPFAAAMAGELRWPLPSASISFGGATNDAAAAPSSEGAGPRFKGSSIFRRGSGEVRVAAFLPLKMTTKVHVGAGGE